MRSDALPDVLLGEPRLKVAVGQHSDRGRKAVNQDFYGFRVPAEPQLSSKGIAVALADGIGSSDVSQVASEFAVMAFLDDYYSTSETWSVRKSADRVLAAANSWLHSRTCQSGHEKDRGYVCALSGLVLKGATAHVFHVGDTRIHRLQGNALEQLTQDHRVQVAHDESYLSRAVGFNPRIEIDYHAVEIERGDVFVLATDGVYEHVDGMFIAQAIREAGGNLDGAARAVVAEAYRRGSTDNLTVQIVSVEDLPEPGSGGLREQLARLALAPLLESGAEIDGYRIVRELHGSARSHLYLALDPETGGRVALKTPATDLQGNVEHLERFMMEEWIARRVSSPHVLKAYPRTRERRFLYVAMEYVEGQTLAQWMADNPRPDLETVRGIVEQVARGLQAFHRLEMLHQDLRPQNIMIDRTGTVKIIDFGSVSVAGVDEHASEILGTLQYTAPEYFVGDGGSERSDLFSLGVMTYQMLSGRLPYGAAAARVRTRAAQRRLRYETLLEDQREIPAWVDAALRKAVQPDPLERYEAFSEFIYDLRHPNTGLLRSTPFIERNPVLFWKAACATLGVALFLALLRLSLGG